MKKRIRQRIYLNGVEMKRDDNKEITKPLNPRLFIDTLYHSTVSVMEWLELEIKRFSKKTDKKMIIVNDENGHLILRYV